MLKAGEFSRKMETHSLLKRGIWFFLIPGLKQIALKEALELLSKLGQSWSLKNIQGEMGCFWLFVNPLDRLIPVSSDLGCQLSSNELGRPNSLWSIPMIMFNFPQRSSALICIFPGRAVTLLFTRNFNSNGHQSTDIQVYDEGKVTSKLS